MNLIVSHYTVFSSLLVLLLIVISSTYFIQFKLLKKEAIQKLSQLNQELKNEQELSEKYYSKTHTLNKKEETMKKKLYHIHLDILNIDFTLKEICNFIRL